eukprot:Skav215570  [mRNA]  locus=scaffold2748:49454:53814:- [translate_table: standard]
MSSSAVEILLKESLGLRDGTEGRPGCNVSWIRQVPVLCALWIHIVQNVDVLAQFVHSRPDWNLATIRASSAWWILSEAITGCLAALIAPECHSTAPHLPTTIFLHTDWCF